MPEIDLGSTPLRELNAALHRLSPDTNERHWIVDHPAGRHAVAALIEESGFKGEDALREAALGGNAPALFEIGARFADGRGTARNPQAAARWFEQAAAAGHAPAQYRLASLYRGGRGITKDQALAFQWFDRAAAQGHVLAMHNAAVLLAEGVHGAPDYAGAALWFRRAAEHGVKDSQFNIAILFARGLGVNQDLGEAYRWFGIAAAQGDQDAARKRDDIAARLTKDQLAKENERIKAFKPARPNAAANEPGNWARIAARAP
ncbi:MAG: tetratricopeptide repeat protein [Rhabdaerophilum calidifontis]